VPRHVDGIGENAVSSLYFTDAAERAIRAHARSDPLVDVPNWVVSLETASGLHHYEIVPDRRPHAAAVVNNTLLTTSDKTFMTHRQLHDALDGCGQEEREECLRAIANEYNSFDSRAMWKLVPLPAGAVCHRMMLLGKIKLFPDGRKEKTKFRAVIVGSDYQKGRDYEADTYAPCPQIVTARCMIHDAVVNRKQCKKCDVKQAFTFGKADRRAFVHCPPGMKRSYDSDGKPLVYEISGNCYGSPSAPCRWHVEIHNAMIKHGFRQSTADACLYILDELRVLVYTDDCLSTFPNTPEYNARYKNFVDMLTSNFELGDDGFQDCNDYIGMHLEWNADRTSVLITQPSKIQELLAESNLLNCKPMFTTGVPKTLVSERDCPPENDIAQRKLMATKPYRRRLGQLLWISRSSRPDIAYQVNALARVAHNPGIKHWQESTLLLKYLSHTQHMGLAFRYSEPSQLCMWSDATWAPDYGTFYDNYRSTTGWGCTSGYNLLSWTSHRQPVVAQSSAESEWYAAADAAKEAEFIKNIFSDLGFSDYGAIPLLCDNQSTIKQTLNAVDQRSSRHLGMRSHFLRQQCHSKRLGLHFVPSRFQVADIFTKVLPRPAHEFLRSRIGVMSPTEFHSWRASDHKT
jgi:hypothetical protein